MFFFLFVFGFESFSRVFLCFFFFFKILSLVVVSFVSFSRVFQCFSSCLFLACYIGFIFLSFFHVFFFRVSMVSHVFIYFWGGVSVVSYFPGLFHLFYLFQGFLRFPLFWGCFSFPKVFSCFYFWGLFHFIFSMVFSCCYFCFVLVPFQCLSGAFHCPDLLKLPPRFERFISLQCQLAASGKAVLKVGLKSCAWPEPPSSEAAVAFNDEGRTAQPPAPAEPNTMRGPPPSPGAGHHPDLSFQAPSLRYGSLPLDRVEPTEQSRLHLWSQEGMLRECCWEKLLSMMGVCRGQQPKRMTLERIIGKGGDSQVLLVERDCDESGNRSGLP